MRTYACVVVIRFRLELSNEYVCVHVNGKIVRLQYLSHYLVFGLSITVTLLLQERKIARQDIRIQRAKKTFVVAEWPAIG